MNRALGYLQIIGPEKTETFETFTCAHCNCVVTMPRDTSITKATEVKRDVRRCAGCDALTCPRCAKTPSCTPFMRKIEAVERAERLLIAAHG
jgi:hypothetical protein